MYSNTQKVIDGALFDKGIASRKKFKNIYDMFILDSKVS